MGRCKLCGKSTGLFSKSTICSNCRDELQTRINYEVAFIERLNNDIGRGYKRLEPYISRYSKILDAIDQIDQISDILGNVKSTSKDNVIEQMESFIPTFIEKNIEEAYQYQRNNTVLNKLMDIQDDIEKCIENYDILHSTLSKAYDEVADHIDKYTKNPDTIFWGNEIVPLLTEEEYKKYNTDVIHFDEILETVKSYWPYELKMKPIIRKPKKINKLNRNFSILKKDLKTPTGKDAKFPTELLFSTNEEEDFDNDLFGKVFYTKDGLVGKATLNFWKDHKGCTVEIRSVNGNLYVSRMDITNTQGGRDTIYSI